MTGSRDVVITGLGPITAAGIGVAGLRRGLRSERSPVRTVTRFDATPFRSRIAAEIDAFDPSDLLDSRTVRRTDRFVQLTLAATRLALDDAGLLGRWPEIVDLDPTRTAVQLGSAMGGIAHAENQLRSFLETGARSLDPRLATTTFAGAASCQVAVRLGIVGPNATNAMSCAAGTIAIGEAARLVRDGVVDVAIAGGADAPLAPVCFGAFAALRAMSTRNDRPSEACRPFDSDRDGFVMGEGACVLVLEEAGRARARGARVYARVAGFGTNNDAHHMAAPRPDGSVAAAAIEQALAGAALPPSAVDHVNAHGSSTPLNDRVESMVVRRALGRWADDVSVTGTKAYHGHALGASGAIEAAVVCLTIADGWVPPTLNLVSRGEGCDLDYVGLGVSADVAHGDGGVRGRVAEVEVALKTSFGFGGINAVLCLTAPHVQGRNA